MEENIKPLSEIPAINRFLSYCRIRAVPSKTVVIHAGDLPDVLYYIISGSVEVMIEDEEGNEMVLAYLNRSEEHTSELQSLAYLVCRLLLEKKKKKDTKQSKLRY